ncbi:integrase catalytic domain-containing protein [Trichonephila clavipes]|nr:integrase catalytic domain-containing protein [Trichonephila clavipes]
MACCIGARLVHSVYAALDVPDLKIIAWSDSMVAFWWLKNHGDWSVFVANKVNEINSLVPSQFWRHVPGELNPADLLSRGISPRLFSNSLWWEGPSWLLEPPSNWPIDHFACETSEVEREKRKIRLCNLVAVEGKYLEKWEFREIGDLTIHEIEHAEKTLIKIVKLSFFPSENSFPNMNVITDEESIKRVKTRITERSDHPEFIYLLFLPGECLLPNGSLNTITDKIVMLELKFCSSEPVSLPGDRVVLDAAVFETFYCQEGRPLVIYSDNGTNFRGAHGELNGIDWEKVLKLATIQRIIWKFNPPTAGWWERLVPVLKELLRRTLGNAILTTEELQTVLCDCESVINSRPLTYLSENSDDLVPLSPAMFLVENRSLVVPDIDNRDTVNLRKRVRYRQIVK